MRNKIEDTPYNAKLKTRNSEPQTHDPELKTRGSVTQRDDSLVNELMIRRIMAALRGLE